MSFLKRLGSILTKTSQIVTGIAPTIGGLFPSAQPTIDAILGIVLQAEVMGQVANLPGAEKLKVAAPLVAQLIMASPLLQGKKIKDQAAFDAAVSGIASNFADLLNSIDEKGVKVEKG